MLSAIQSIELLCPLWQFCSLIRMLPKVFEVASDRLCRSYVIYLRNFPALSALAEVLRVAHRSDGRASVRFLPSLELRLVCQIASSMSPLFCHACHLYIDSHRAYAHTICARICPVCPRCLARKSSLSCPSLKGVRGLATTISGSLYFRVVYYIAF